MENKAFKIGNDQKFESKEFKFLEIKKEFELFGFNRRQSNDLLKVELKKLIQKFHCFGLIKQIDANFYSNKKISPNFSRQNQSQLFLKDNKEVIEELKAKLDTQTEINNTMKAEILRLRKEITSIRKNFRSKVNDNAHQVVTCFSVDRVNRIKRVL